AIYKDNAMKTQHLQNVRDLMTPTPVFVSPTTSVDEARALMQQHRIRHLPVLGLARLVGMVSDRDIRLVLPSPATSLSVYEIGYLLVHLTVAEIMHRFPITITPDRPVTEAIRGMLAHQVGALLVVAEGKVVGIVTRTNLLQAFLLSQGELPAVACVRPGRALARATTQPADYLLYWPLKGDRTFLPTPVSCQPGEGE